MNYLPFLSFPNLTKVLPESKLHHWATLLADKTIIQLELVFSLTALWTRPQALVCEVILI